MLTAVKGIYENGEVKLTENPPTQNRVEVIVTFMEEQTPEPLKKRQAGVLSGKIKMSDDFDEPLDDLKGYM